jgi:hypothetical protein
MNNTGATRFSIAGVGHSMIPPPDRRIDQRGSEP